MRNVGEPRPTRLADAAQSVITSVRGWRRRRATYRELAALDERMLKDIGITRNDIASIVRGDFWRLTHRVGDRNE